VTVIILLMVCFVIAFWALIAQAIIGIVQTAFKKVTDKVKCKFRKEKTVIDCGKVEVVED